MYESTVQNYIVAFPHPIPNQSVLAGNISTLWKPPSTTFPKATSVQTANLCSLPLSFVPHHSIAFIIVASSSCNVTDVTGASTAPFLLSLSRWVA